MKANVKYILITLLLAVGWAGAWAQPDPAQREEKIRNYRIAVFTRVLNLTSEEAQGFWPVYNEYLDKREAIQKELRPDPQLDGMSDAEVEEYIKKHIEMRVREVDLEKELIQKLRKVLPPRKIAKIPEAEREFREALVKKVQEARERRMDRPNRGR